MIKYFSETTRPDEATVLPKLNASLSEVLAGLINRQWIQNGSWPTIGEAVKSNERIFAIIRTEFPFDESAALFIPEIQVRDGKPGRSKNGNEKAITVLTTFKSM